MEGYWKFHRKLQDTPLWLDEKFSRGQAWADLIGLANHKDGYIRVRGIRVVVKRGEVGWSERRIALRWKWSRDKVRRFLSELKEDEMIYHRKTNVTSLISITNYKVYQGSDTTDQTTEKPQTRPQTDHKRYPNKNGKNDKKLKSTPKSPPKRGARSEKVELKYEDYPGFMEFYSTYPMKKAKYAALESWVKMKLEKHSGGIIKAVETLKNDAHWMREDATKVPYPSTFLNQRRFDDVDPNTPSVYKKRKARLPKIPDGFIMGHYIKNYPEKTEEWKDWHKFDYMVDEIKSAWIEYKLKNRK